MDNPPGPEHASPIRRRAVLLVMLVAPGVLAACEGGKTPIGPGSGPRVIVEPASAEPFAFEWMQFTVAMADSTAAAPEAGSVNWSVSDSALARVDGFGRLTALAAGDVKVVAAVDGSADTAVVQIGATANREQCFDDPPPDLPAQESRRWRWTPTGG